MNCETCKHCKSDSETHPCKYCTGLNKYEEQKDSQLLGAVKLAYRKHHLGDDSIGWSEVSDALYNALCSELGDDEFRKWIGQNYGRVLRNR